MSSIPIHLNKSSFIKWNLFCSFPGPGLYCRAQLMLLCVIQISQYSFFDLKLAAQFILIQKKNVFSEWASVTENKEHQNRLPLKKNHIYMVVSLQDILAILLTATAVPVHFYPRVSNAAFLSDVAKIHWRSSCLSKPSKKNERFKNNSHFHKFTKTTLQNFTKKRFLYLELLFPNIPLIWGDYSLFVTCSCFALLTWKTVDFKVSIFNEFIW